MPQCFIPLCTVLPFTPTETRLSSSQTGLGRLSRARDAALCRSPTAANSHYQINLFEGFLLKADKSCYHAHPSLAKVWSWSIWNIVEIFRFCCRLCIDFIQTIFFSTFKLTLACLLFVHHILEFMIIQHIMKSHAALAAVVFPLG